MTTKPSQFAALAAHFLLIAATGAAVLAIGTFLFPRQFPPLACLLALGAVVGASLLATALLARRQSSGDNTPFASFSQNGGGSAGGGFVFSPDPGLCSDIQVLGAEFDRWLKTTGDFGLCQIFLRSSAAEEMLRAHPVRINLREPGFTFSPESPLCRFFQETTEPYLNGHGTPFASGEIAVAAREVCVSLGASFCLPLRCESDLFGLLLVEARRETGQNPGDSLERLILAARQLSLLISHQRLREQLRLVQETELLGMMSRGLAHDLNNLITPAWTYLQLCQSGQAGPSANAELLPTALRNMETMRDYVEEALFFSQNHQPQFLQRNVQATIQKVIEPLAPILKHAGLQLYTTVEANLGAYYDEILMRRLLGNLLNNAIDASPAGSRIDIEAMPLTKANPRQDWLRLRIRDQGSGMTPENLKRVLDSDFSTRERSLETRGSGLGLAICQKIVKLHHGELQLTSVAGRGTTIEIDLPCQQADLGAAPSARPVSPRIGIHHIA